MPRRLAAIVLVIALLCGGWWWLRGGPDGRPVGAGVAAEGGASKPGGAGGGDGAATQPAASAPASPLDLIPARCMLAWKGEPVSAEEAARQQSALDVLVRTVTKIAGANIPPMQKLTLRLLEGFGAVITRPFALALLDADTLPTARSIKGDNFKIVLVVDADGDISPFLRIVQNAVNELTDQSLARLTAHEAHGYRYAELVDQRLPGWCRIAWGQIDDCFVLTFGVEVWPQVAAVAAGEQPSVTRDGWVAPLRGKLAHSALLEILVDAGAIRDKLDPSTGGKASAFFDAWGVGELDRSLWALGLEGKALYCEAFYRMPDQTVRRLYADPDFDDPALLAVVPQEEDARYAVYQVSPREFLPKLFDSFYRTRPPEVRERAIRLWERIQQRHGFDAQRDVLANLGERVILHNQPLHPLRIPLAFTTVAPIERNPQVVRDTIETMCAAWQAGLQEIAEREGRPNPLQRDPGDIWYLRFGFIDGVAWTVTDKYIITSWSPWALRTYLSQMGDTLGRRE